MSAKILPFYNPRHKNAKPKGKATEPWKPVKKRSSGICLMAMRGLPQVFCSIVVDTTHRAPSPEDCKIIDEVLYTLNELERKGDLLYYEYLTYSCFDDDYDFDDYLDHDECDFRAPASDRIIRTDQNVVHVQFPIHSFRFTF